MRPHRRRALLLVAIFTCALASAAQAAVEVRVAVEPRTVGQTQPLTVRVIVTGDDVGRARLEGEPPRGEKLIPSSGVSTSTSMTFINGVSSSERTFTLTYLPTALGKGQVPSLVVLVDGARYHTEPVPVTIVARETNSDRAATEELPVEVLTRASRRELYVGETLQLEHVLRSRINVESIAADDAPTFPGFVIDVEKLDPATTQRDTRDDAGRVWREWTVARRKLTPTRAGRLEIPPVAFSVTIERRMRDFFGIGFPGQSQRAGVIAAGSTIEVKPLPEQDRPADFSGAVGQFRIDAQIAPQALRAGDAADLQLELRGSGALAAVAPPEFPIAPEIEPFAWSEQPGRDAARRWTRPLVPQRAGRFTVGPFSFSYFDPKTGRYERASAPALQLEVGPGSGNATNGHAVDSTQTHGSLPPFPAAPHGVRASRWRWPWAVVALPWLLFAGLPLWRSVRQRRAATAAGRRAALQRRLAGHVNAARGSVASDPAGATRELLLALHGWADQRIGVPSRPLSRPVLQARLIEAGESADRAAHVASLFDRIEALRYAPGGDHAALQAAIEAVALLLEPR